MNFLFRALFPAVCVLCKITLEASTPCLPLFSLLAYTVPCTTPTAPAAVPIFPSLSLFLPFVFFIPHPPRGPPPPSHIVLLVFYRSGCFTFFLCDGFCHEPTSYNLITFPSQHQSHYNSESSFLFPPPPSSLHSPFTSTIATNKDVIILSPPASTRRGPSPPTPSLSILRLFSVPLGLAFVWWLLRSLYVFPPVFTGSRIRWTLLFSVFLASVLASHPYSRTDIYF